MKLPRILSVLIGIGLLLAALGCSRPAPVQVGPTPDLESTVAARVAATMEAVPTPTPAPTPAPTATPTPTKTPKPTLTPLPQTGEWETTKSLDPLTDKPSITAVLKANDKQRLGLILRCKNGEVDLFITWGDYLGSDDPKVTWRIDDERPKTRSWSLSTNKAGTFYPSMINGITPGAFIAQLAAADRFVVQVTPYNEGPVTAVFDLKGIDVIAPQVLELCR